MASGNTLGEEQLCGDLSVAPVAKESQYVSSGCSGGQGAYA